MSFFLRSSPARTGEADQGSGSRLRRQWADTPLRSKLTTLVLIAAVAGALAAAIDTALGHQGWPLVAMVLTGAYGVTRWAHRSIAEPAERLAEQSEAAAQQQRPPKRAELPLDRADELGRLASQIHGISVRAHQHQTESMRLRKALERRVEAAKERTARRMEDMALRDPLTGLANRRFLEDQLDPMIDAHRQAGADLLCLAIDMDGFKEVNDTLGHSRGDELLKLLADLLKGNCRPGDCLVRFGGDEFLIFLPHATADRAAQLYHRVAELLAQHVRNTFGAETHIGLSAGLSSLLRDQPADGNELIERADANLYEAKDAGRGQLIGAPPEWTRKTE